MSLAATPCCWTLCLLSESDFDDESNTWAWDADLVKRADGSYRATVAQCPGAPGEEDWVAAVLEGELHGEDLFHFFQASWAEHTANKLDETQWRAVAALIQQRDEPLAAQFTAAMDEEFHPAPEEPYQPPMRDSPLDRCVQGARWSMDGSGGASGLAGVVFNNLRRQAAYMHAARYLVLHGVLPTGTHHVAAEVGPPKSGADFAHPMGGGTCSLSVDITFPGSPDARTASDIKLPGTRPEGDGSLALDEAPRLGLPPVEMPSPALVAAYRDTDYSISSGEISLTVDGPVPSIDEWLRAHQARAAVIITAFNPFSVQTPEPENHRRQESLRAFIGVAGLRYFAAMGTARSGDWPGEPSLCVLDPTAAQVDDWLLKFEQYAVVHAAASVGCRLVWHPAIRERMTDEWQ